jgi:SAM-dependent methyltransferase
MQAVIVAILLLLALSFAYAAARGAPWVPTRRADIDRLCRLADLNPGDVFYDLGCGDGRVCLEVSRRSGASGVGVELSLVQWMIGSLRAKLSGLPVSMRLADMDRVSLSDATAVYLFLLPEVYARLRPLLERDLRPGAKVLTYVWPMPGWEHDRLDHVEGSSDLYLYVVK